MPRLLGTRNMTGCTISLPQVSINDIAYATFWPHGKLSVVPRYRIVSCERHKSSILAFSSIIILLEWLEKRLTNKRHVWSYEVGEPCLLVILNAPQIRDRSPDSSGEQDGVTGGNGALITYWSGYLWPAGGISFLIQVYRTSINVSLLSGKRCRRATCPVK